MDRNRNEREEWHITVAGDPIRWVQFCRELGVKPLWIELSTFDRQLMCAAPEDISHHIPPQFQLLRRKHERDRVAAGVVYCYWEVHVKLNGPEHRLAKFPVGLRSRDLLRQDRWYVTKRAEHPFDVKAFVEDVQHFAPRYEAEVAGFESEVCLLDTNPAMDWRWVEGR